LDDRRGVEVRGKVIATNYQNTADQVENPPFAGH
jgi:hypothetical protein